MDIDMAGQTVREHLQLLFVVRFSVAFTTIRNLAMLLMAHRARDLAMLARCALPLGVNRIMAPATGFHIILTTEADLQWCVHPVMARLAVIDLLSLKMPFMTFKAVRDVAVLLMMATLATLLRVCTRELLQFIGRTRMTVGASFAELFHRRDLQRRMGVLVTTKTLSLLGAMGLSVAG